MEYGSHLRYHQFARTPLRVPQNNLKVQRYSSSKPQRSGKENRETDNYNDQLAVLAVKTDIVPFDPMTGNGQNPDWQLSGLT